MSDSRPNYESTSDSSDNVEPRTSDRRNFDWTSSSDDSDRSDFCIRDWDDVRNWEMYRNDDSEPEDHHWRGELPRQLRYRERGRQLDSTTTSQLYLDGRRHIRGGNVHDRLTRTRYNAYASDDEQVEDSDRSRGRTSQWVEDPSDAGLSSSGSDEADDARIRRSRFTRSRSRERDWHRDDRWRVYDYEIRERNPTRDDDWYDPGCQIGRRLAGYPSSDDGRP